MSNKKKIVLGLVKELEKIEEVTVNSYVYDDIEYMDQDCRKNSTIHLISNGLCEMYLYKNTTLFLRYSSYGGMVTRTDLNTIQLLLDIQEKYNRLLSEEN
ncbi:MAG: hypothetical protein RSH78_05080 [Bacilli bacterium]|uniref:hypothetical protein n=1 Tax=Clostridium sp. TaxID=1506 RepID=UPI002FCB656E